MPIYKAYASLESAFKKNISFAITETALEAVTKLRECVLEQYYNDPEFYPKVYERTETFLNSVTYRMFSTDMAEVYIDIEGMHYKNGFDAWEVVNWASESKHGSDYFQTSTENFWHVFIEWADKNLVTLLKKNLRKYKINVK